jgi:hypothetical protein
MHFPIKDFPPVTAEFKNQSPLCRRWSFGEAQRFQSEETTADGDELVKIKELSYDSCNSDQDAPSDQGPAPGSALQSG